MSTGDEHLPSPAPNAPPADAGADPGRYATEDDGQARDRLLQRQVAIERSDAAQADDLIDRARFLARLDHPALGVVHDVVRGDAGAMLVMRPLKGQTLAAAIAAAAAGDPPEALASPADLVRLFIGLGAAIAAVHARGVVHRALTAEAVVLGPFGELRITCWSAAMESLLRPMTLCFVAGQAPQPALALDGRHADVRALGRMLLAAAARREDGIGALAPISPAERSLVPPPVERIARLAAISDAAAGYQSVEAFTDDLRAVLQGNLPPRAATPADRASWFLSRHRIAIAAGMVLLVAAWLLAGRGLVEDLRWRVLAEERFDGATLPTRWVEKSPGSFALHRGSLVTTAEREAVLIFRQRVSVPVVVECTGRLEPGAQPGDLSLAWSEVEALDAEPGRLLDGRATLLQLGAYDNSYSAIIDFPGAQRLDYRPWRLEPGRTYRLRFEIGTERFRVLVDGRPVLDGQSLRPTTSGHVALYSYYPGKVFDDVRISQLRVPAVVTPLAGGNAVAALGMHREAARLYAEVAAAHGRTPIGEEALYRRGRSERLAGDAKAAQRAWAAITDPYWAGLGECQALEDLAATWQHDQLLTRLATLYRSHDELRYHLRMTWQGCLRRVLEDVRRDAGLVDAYMRLREELFPDDAASRALGAEAYLRTRRPERVIEGFPDEQRLVAISLLAMGRAQDLLDKPWALPDDRFLAHEMRGEYAQALAIPRIEPRQRAMLLAKLGRYDEALALLPDAPELLLLAGRADEVLRSRPLTASTALAALLASGRWDEAAGPGLPEVPGSGGSAVALALAGRVGEALTAGPGALADAWALIAAVEGGDRTAAEVLLAKVDGYRDQRRSNGLVTAAIIAPLARQALGDAAEPMSSWQRALPALRWLHGQRLYRVLGCVMGSGDEGAVRSLPAVSEAGAWLQLALGLRAELSGDTAAAIAAYTTFRAMPVSARLLNGHAPDQEVEALVAWRLRTLARP